MKETRKVSFNPSKSNGIIRPNWKIYIFIYCFAHKLQVSLPSKLLPNGETAFLWDTALLREERGCRVYRVSITVHVCHYASIWRCVRQTTRLNPSCGAPTTNVIKFNYKLSKLLESSSRTDYRGNDRTIRRAARETDCGLHYITTQLFCKPKATMERQESSARDKSVLR